MTGQGNQYTDTTGANGFYEIDNLVTGTYAKVAASGPGYFGSAHSGKAVSIGDFHVPADFTNFDITRDWAATSGGAQVVDFDGPDFSPQCGPDGAFDTSLSTGWGSDDRQRRRRPHQRVRPEDDHGEAAAGGGHRLVPGRPDRHLW